jgi:hypothetical protein
MEEKNMNKIVPIMITGILILSGFGVIAIDNSNSTLQVKEIIRISQPIFHNIGGYLSVDFEESDSFICEPGKPLLPVVTKAFTFPLGTNIVTVDVDCKYKEYILSKKIQPASELRIMSEDYSQEIKQAIPDKTVYGPSTFYPTESYMVSSGAGLCDNDHVLFLTVKVLARYSPLLDLLLVPQEIEITVEYQVPEVSLFHDDEYDMVIIAPDEFLSEIQSLIDHKNSVGIKTFLKTTEEIYEGYTGRDNAEKIKYFIKDAIEVKNVSYALLIGDVDKLPLRTIFWDIDMPIDMLTDLYYADIYDSEDHFCSWDSNNNNDFGEEDDGLDFYPDIHIGRLACTTSEEVGIVVDKIIHYERETFGQRWFNNLILMGGDTFPEAIFPDAKGREGEELNQIIMEIMSDFEPITIWTSKGNFKRDVIAQEINRGAGFLFYSGHGCEFAITPEAGPGILYVNRYVNDLANGYKLPIMFFTACNTAKLDFVLEDMVVRFQEMFGSGPLWIMFELLKLLFSTKKDMPLPCFAWNFVKHEGGGAIAAVGSTNYILSSMNDPVHNRSGCINPPIYFFDAYNSSETVGQMMTKSVNDYILDIPTDPLAEYTIMEHILLGDPSLKIGGYP